MRAWLTFPLLCLAAPSAVPSAAPYATGPEAFDPTCRNGLFPSEPPFALARVTGKGRAWFHDDTDGCPDRARPGTAACRSRSYVVPGDMVVINRSHGAHSCAFYPSRGGGTAGWVERKRLSVAPHNPQPPLAAWLGRWSSEGNPEVTIRRSGGRLRITGEAFWPGREVPPDSPYQSIHTGELDGALSVSGAGARYGDENGCEVTFSLLGPLLIAYDSGNCGGMNVRFSGVYRKVAG